MNTIYLLFGPNLNWLGQRNPSHYGTLTYAQLVEKITLSAQRLGYTLHAIQSNHEGTLLDTLQEAYEKKAVGVLFNPGALTHYAYSLCDAVEMKTIPVVEVHLSNIDEREPWRRHSVIATVVDARFMGKGYQSMEEALEWLIATHENKLTVS